MCVGEWYEQIGVLDDVDFHFAFHNDGQDGFQTNEELVAELIYIVLEHIECVAFLPVRQVRGEIRTVSSIILKG